MASNRLSNNSSARPKSYRLLRSTPDGIRLNETIASYRPSNDSSVGPKCYQAHYFPPGDIHLNETIASNRSSNDSSVRPKIYRPQLFTHGESRLNETIASNRSSNDSSVMPNVYRPQLFTHGNSRLNETIASNRSSNDSSVMPNVYRPQLFTHGNSRLNETIASNRSSNDSSVRPKIYRPQLYTHGDSRLHETKAANRPSNDTSVRPNCYRAQSTIPSDRLLNIITANRPSNDSSTRPKSYRPQTLPPNDIRLNETIATNGPSNKSVRPKNNRRLSTTPADCLLNVIASNSPSDDAKKKKKSNFALRFLPGDDHLNKMIVDINEQFQEITSLWNSKFNGPLSHCPKNPELNSFIDDYNRIHWSEDPSLKFCKDKRWLNSEWVILEQMCQDGSVYIQDTLEDNGGKRYGRLHITGRRCFISRFQENFPATEKNAIVMSFKELLSRLGKEYVLPTTVFWQLKIKKLSDGASNSVDDGKDENCVNVVIETTGVTLREKNFLILCSGLSGVSYKETTVKCFQDSCIIPNGPQPVLQGLQFNDPRTCWKEKDLLTWTAENALMIALKDSYLYAGHKIGVVVDGLQDLKRGTLYFVSECGFVIQP